MSRSLRHRTRTAFHPVLVLSLALVVQAGEAIAQDAPATQAEIIEDLRSDDRRTRLRAASVAGNWAVDEMSVQLRSALIEALEAEGATAARRRRGEIGQLEVPELIARLALVVSRLDNPSAIPALAGALGTSPGAIYGLASFGGIAAPEIIKVLRREADGSVEGDGLLALRFIVQGAGRTPLTPPVREEIRAFAMWYFEGERGPAPLRMAIDLALALDDPDLRGIVEDVAQNGEAVRRFGISNPRHIAYVQEHAAERLAGAPARPACCPPR